MLTETDRAILDIERQHWRHAGTKNEAVRAQLDLTATRYYQRLSVLLDDPEALAYAPMVVNRLRRRLNRR